MPNFLPIDCGGGREGQRGGQDQRDGGREGERVREQESGQAAARGRRGRHVTNDLAVPCLALPCRGIGGRLPRLPASPAPAASLMGTITTAVSLTALQSQHVLLSAHLFAGKSCTS
ncbi:hypothetical protein E2C01_079997 [Portunus trituberculatus]|uniref:Uncharacterized protein n=1 Tax=Portunus trituberculatus TaxID=210409 RepID=A0A5B7IS88_PORTR|nr:hypothetical protein [Portunus trituberculatus]